MSDAPPARRRCRARGTARRPTPAAPARADRDRLSSDGALAIRQRIRAPLKFAVPPSRTSQHGVPAALRSDRQPPRRGEVERSRIAPDLADHAGERRASYALLHRPQRVAGVARLDMDEVLQREPRRMDPPAFEDRHPLLHPQQRLSVPSCASRNPAQPPSRGCAANSSERVGWSDFGEGSHLRREGFSRGKALRPLTRAELLPQERISGRSGDSSAGDQRQASCHTTHNVYVLLLFLSARLARQRVESRNSGRFFDLRSQEHRHDLAHRGARACLRHRRKPMWVELTSTALSRSASVPRADGAPTIPSRRDQIASVGTGGFSTLSGIGGSSTGCPATHSYSRHTLV